MSAHNRAPNMKMTLLLGLTLAFGGHLGGSMCWAATEPLLLPVVPVQDSRPDGLRVIEEACIQCHDLDLVFSQEKAPDSWERTIVMMMWRGAQLVPGEAAMIQTYLVSDYGQNLTPSSSEASVLAVANLAEGHGKTLVVSACAGCHDLSPVVAARRSPGDWRQIVEEMVRLGAPLNGGESETVIGYLSASFAP